jgi:hypothetical protein
MPQHRFHFGRSSHTRLAAITGDRTPAAAVSREVDNPPQTPVSTPSRLDVMRYRYHHGVNIGSCFVLEKWLSPFAFPMSAGNDQSSELAAVTLSVVANGLSTTRNNFENRWAHFIADSDCDWLVNNARCKSQRICNIQYSIIT